MPSPRSTIHPSTHETPHHQVVFLPNGKVLTVHKPGELHVYDSILAKSQVRRTGRASPSCLPMLGDISININACMCMYCSH